MSRRGNCYDNAGIDGWEVGKAIAKTIYQGPDSMSTNWLSQAAASPAHSHRQLDIPFHNDFHGEGCECLLTQ